MSESDLILFRVKEGNFILKVSLFQKSYVALITDLQNEVLWTQEDNCTSIQIAKEKGLSMVKNFAITDKYLLLLKQYYKEYLHYQKEQDYPKAYFYLQKVLFCIRRFLIRRLFGFWYFIPNKQNL